MNQGSVKFGFKMLPIIVLGVIITAIVQKCNAQTAKASPKSTTPRINKPKALQPVLILGSYLEENEIGTPIAHIVYTNTTSKKIDAVTFDISCLDNYGDPVNSPGGDNIYRGICQDYLEPKDTADKAWTLYLYDNTTKIKPKVVRFHYDNDLK